MAAVRQIPMSAATLLLLGDVDALAGFLIASIEAA